MTSAAPLPPLRPPLTAVPATGAVPATLGRPVA